MLLVLCITACDDRILININGRAGAFVDPDEPIQFIFAGDSWMADLSYGINDGWREEAAPCNVINLAVGSTTAHRGLAVSWLTPEREAAVKLIVEVAPNDRIVVVILQLGINDSFYGFDQQAIALEVIAVADRLIELGVAWVLVPSYSGNLTVASEEFWELEVSEDYRVQLVDLRDLETVAFDGLHMDSESVDLRAASLWKRGGIARCR